MGPTARPRDRWIAWIVGMVAVTGAYAVTRGVDRRIQDQHRRPAVQLAFVAAPSRGCRHRRRSCSLSPRARRILTASTRLAAVLDSSRRAAWFVAVAAVWTLRLESGLGHSPAEAPTPTATSGRRGFSRTAGLTDTIPVSPDYQWPNVEATLTPLGFTKGQSRGCDCPDVPAGAATASRAVFGHFRDARFTSLFPFLVLFSSG